MMVNPDRASVIMTDPRPQYCYIHYSPSGPTLAADSLGAAKAALAREFTHAHFGSSSEIPIGTSVPVWENGAARLRYELGETVDECRPVAQVINCRIQLPTR
jgi:hypothetical protein